MFRKPRSRNVRQRLINLNDEDSDETSPVKSSTGGHSAAQVRTDGFPKGVLSFNESEEDDAISFKLKKDKTGIKVKKSHKISRRAQKTEVSEDEEDHKLYLKTEILETEEEDEIIIEREIQPKKKVDPTLIPDEEFRRYQAISQSTSQHSNATRSKFASLSSIPDEKMIYEARKRRQAARDGHSDQPPLLNLDEPLSLNKNQSRLIREDENDASDDDEGAGRFISSSNLLMNEEVKRRNDQLEALKVEQGSDDEDAKDKESEDEEIQRWEQEQIKKAVSQKKITEFKSEYAANRKFNNHPATLMDMGIIMENEDMEIDQVGNHQMPAFFNSDGTYKVDHKYHSMADLVEQLELTRGKKIEQLKVQKYEYENNERNLKVDQDSVYKLAESNGKMELYFKLYQEMKFFTDNVMDCLNEKVNEINEIDKLFMDCYNTRANDISRRRAEAMRRAKYNRHEQWDSEDEENRDNEFLQENIARFRARALMLFADASAEYHDLNQIYRRFIDWLIQDPKTFQEAFIDECIPKLITPLVRIELYDWNPLLPGNRQLSTMEWYKAVLRLGFDDTEVDANHAVITSLIPNIVEKIVIPKLTKIVKDQYDPLSSTQTVRLITEISNMANTFYTLNSKSNSFKKLLRTLKEKAQETVDLEMQIPQHLQSIVTSITMKKEVQSHGKDDIAALLAASKSVMK